MRAGEECSRKNRVSAGSRIRCVSTAVASTSHRYGFLLLSWSSTFRSKLFNKIFRSSYPVLSQLSYATSHPTSTRNTLSTLPSSSPSSGKLPPFPHKEHTFSHPSFIVALSISFRMSSAYSRWWEGRTEWDKISALTRNIARTIWLHVPEQKTDPDAHKSDVETKKYVITLLHAFAVALKHHLRGQRNWDELHELRKLLTHLPHVRVIRHEPFFFLSSSNGLDANLCLNSIT